MTGPRATRRLDAVFFDMDGTLLDSERVWQTAIDDLARTLGGRLPATSRAAMVGAHTRLLIDRLCCVEAEGADRSRDLSITVVSQATCERAECDTDPVVDGNVGGEFVVAAQVLHERVAGRDRA